jgi:curved DNA-binding protein CbpA
MSANYYQILETYNRVSPEELKKAYRKMAQEFHPDRYLKRSLVGKQRSEKMIRLVNEAYEVLSNPERRALYDRCLREGRNFGEAEALLRPESAAEQTAREDLEAAYRKAKEIGLGITLQAIRALDDFVVWKQVPSDPMDLDGYFDAILEARSGGAELKLHVKILPEFSSAHVPGLLGYAETVAGQLPRSLSRHKHSYLILAQRLLEPHSLEALVASANHRLWVAALPRSPQVFLAYASTKVGKVVAPGVLDPVPDLAALHLRLAALFG